ncbi:MAG: oligosaccharide flippase family protein [Coleofasciculus sp. S288]|nr:oligosaccharide flippase family protein [Coleofasciculus sp. S288]
MTISLKKQAIRGAAWTFVGYGTSQVLRFGSNVLLTRLLVPEYFGLMALVSTFLIGLQLFSDIGIGPNVIQNKRGDDPVFLNTIWTIQVIRSFGLWLACILISWPLATFYEEPQLLQLIPVIGLKTCIEGFTSTAVWTLNRNMALDKLIKFELLVQLISLTVMIVWAWLSPTIWALVAGNLASGLLKAVGSHRLLPGKSNRFTWDKEAAKSIFSFGKWIFISTAFTFLGTQADRLILGKLFSFELLGVYGIAFTLAYLPSQVISMISSKVILPAVSKLAHEPRQSLRAKILRNRRLLLVVTAIALTLFVSFGDIVILTLYDQRYSQAAWMMPILALGIWPLLLHGTVRQSLLAIGKPNYEAYGQFFKALLVCLGIPVAFHFMGALGAVIVVALNDIPLYGAVSYGLCREKLSTIKQDVWATALLFILLALVLMGRFLSGFGLPISRLFDFQ